MEVKTRSRSVYSRERRVAKAFSFRAVISTGSLNYTKVASYCVLQASVRRAAIAAIV